MLGKSPESLNYLTCLIIRLIIQMIRRNPFWIDGASNVSSLDPSGADQIDAEHQPTDLAVGSSNPSRRTKAQVSSLGLLALLVPLSATTGRPKGVSSQASELGDTKLGITPFDCPCDSPMSVFRPERRTTGIEGPVIRQRCKSTQVMVYAGRGPLTGRKLRVGRPVAGTGRVAFKEANRSRPSYSRGGRRPPPGRT
jgi:hypothetical protein